MEFRDLPGGHRIQQPSLEEDELDEREGSLRGSFDISFQRLKVTDTAPVTGNGQVTRSILSGGASQSHISPADLFDVHISALTLAGARWHVPNARRIEMTGCRATGWQLSMGSARDVYIADSKLDFARIKIEQCQGRIVLQRCLLHEALLEGDLSGLVVLDSELTAVEFAATHARGADLRGAHMDDASGWETMRGSHITAVQATQYATDLAVSLGVNVEQ